MTENQLFNIKSKHLFRLKKHSFSLILWTILRLFPEISSAQGLPNLQINFTRQNNFTYATKYDFRYNFTHKKYKSEIFSNHDNLVNSSLPNPFIQISFKNIIWQHYNLSKKWAISSLIEADNFIQNKTHRVNAYIGATFQPSETFLITPMIGYSWDYLSERLNQGVSPALKLKYSHHFKEGLSTENQLFIRAKYIAPRHQRNVLFKSMWQQNFGKFGNLGVGMIAGSNEMDNFKNKSVEKIISDTLNPVFQMQYNLLPQLSFNSENVFAFTRRHFKYVANDTNIVEFNNLQFSQNEINLHQTIQLSLKKWETSFQYFYDYSNRRYSIENNMQLIESEYERLKFQEMQKNFIRQGHSFELKTVYNANEKHFFTLNGSNRYVMYDTPSDENFDDHDELNYGLSVEWNSKWNQKFSTHYQLNGGVRRYAFLFKERSQDNYTQRNLRLGFDYQWNISPKWLLNGEQLVYVTYNVKDFTDANFTDRSTRNLETKVNLSYFRTEKWQHLASLYRKETHLSYLNWEKFAETALDTTQNWVFEQKNVWVMYQKEQKGKALLELGYKHFQLFRYQNTSMINLGNAFQPINLHIRNFQTGLTTGLRWFDFKQNSINLSIWWQYQYLDNLYRPITTFAGFGSNYREEDLQKKGRFFRPFADISVNYRF